MKVIICEAICVSICCAIFILLNISIPELLLWIFAKLSIPELLLWIIVKFCIKIGFLNSAIHSAIFYLLNISTPCLISYFLFKSLLPKVLGNIVKFFIKIGFVNVNARPFIFPTNDTLLHLAVVCRWLEVVKFLIENGADVNVINDFNETPLHLITVPDNDINDDDEEMVLEIVKVLCKNGANVNAKNDQDCSPVDIALQHEDYRLLDHLIPFKSSIPMWG